MFFPEKRKEKIVETYPSDDKVIIKMFFPKNSPPFR